MLKTGTVFVGVLVSLTLLQAGCKEERGEIKKAPVSADQVVNDLTFPDPATHLTAIEMLKKLSPEDQQKVVSMLEDKIKATSNKAAQREYKQALEKAKAALRG